MQFPNMAPVTRRLAVPVPAAGSEWSVTADRGGLWLVRQVTFILATSAAVPARTVALRTSEGDDITLVLGAGTTQAASLTRRYSAAPGSTRSGDSLAAIMIDWPHEGVILPVGCTLATSTTALDVADQYSGVVVTADEYPATWPVWLVPSTTTLAYDMSGESGSMEGM